MRKIASVIACLIVLCLPAQAQTGTAKTPTAIATEINTLWPDNTVGQITPYNARQTLLDIIASFLSNVSLGQGLSYNSNVTQAQPGFAKMWPASGQSTSATVPWNAVDPFGNSINCAGTNSQCLQEFITATASNGWPARVYCQGTQFPSKTEPVFINSTVAISVPVAQDWDFEADSTCNLNLSVTTTSGLTFDSQGATRFIWDGKIVYVVTSPNGNTATNPSCVVYLNPTSTTADGFAGIYAGLIRVKSPVASPVSSDNTGVVCANTSIGSVTQETLQFQELNANNAAYKGILVFGAGSTTGFLQNHIYVNQIHGAIAKAVDEGFTSSNQANYNSNIWVLSNIENNGINSRGVDTYGSNDIFDIGVINNAQGGLQIGIVTESGANYNIMRYGSISGANLEVLLDTGSSNSYQNGVNGTQIASAVSVGGHILATTSSLPSIGSCGSGSPIVTGTDVFGKIGTGGGSLSSCTMNFGRTWGATPDCVVGAQSAVASMTVTASTTLLTIGAGNTSSLANNFVTYHCGSTN